MSSFYNEKKLLLDMKNAVESLKEYKTKEEKNEIYSYLLSSKELLSSLNNKEVSLPYFEELDYDEFNKYSTMKNKSRNSLTISLIEFDNYISDFFNSLIKYSESNINDFINLLNIEDISLSKSDFYDLLKLFSKEINKEKCFNELYKGKNIIKVSSNNYVDFDGQFIYNSVNNNKKIVMTDFDYSLTNLITFVHEFGHYVDFDDLINNHSYSDINNYVNNTYNLEIISLLYEKLFINFLLEKGYFTDSIPNLIATSKYRGLHFIYNVSSILNKYEDIKEGNTSINNVICNKKIFELNDLGLLSNVIYGLGEYYSTILIDDISKNGLDSELFNSYYNLRYKNKGLEYLENNNFNISKYNDIHNKQLSLIKK